MSDDDQRRGTGKADGPVLGTGAVVKKCLTCEAVIPLGGLPLCESCQKIRDQHFAKIAERAAKLRPVPVQATDPVNHPTHYQGTGLEAIDVIEAFGLGFRLGSAVKYIRAAGLLESALRVAERKEKK